MRLGILVVTDRNLQHLTGLTEAALRQGHEVEVFVMAGGVELLAAPELHRISALEGVTASYCAFNAMTHNVADSSIPGSMEPGTQINNLMMARGADRVITL